MRLMANVFLSPLLFVGSTLAGPCVEKNVVYGMYSGLALLMDVHYPEEPNGYGVVHISGSGWSAPLSLDSRPLKEAGHVRIETPEVVKAGYTVFTINHRALPRFQFPAQIEDAQRAVRFVRFHAERYGIDPNKIGGLGGSSGGHLASLLATLDGDGDQDSYSEIDRMSAKIQAAVVRAPPTDFGGWVDSATIGLLLGARLREGMNASTEEMRIAIEASPVSYVSNDDPPMLLIHGDKDDTVPFSQSEKLREALKKAGVTVELVRVDGAGHGPGMRGAKEDPKVSKRAADWFDRYLRMK